MYNFRTSGVDFCDSRVGLRAIGLRFGATRSLKPCAGACKSCSDRRIIQTQVEILVVVVEVRAALISAVEIRISKQLNRCFQYNCV